MAKRMGTLVIVVGAIVLTITMLQAMGVVDGQKLALAGLESVPFLKRPVERYRIGLQAERLLQNKQDEIEELERKIQSFEEEMERQRERLHRQEIGLQRQQAELEQQKRQLDNEITLFQSQINNTRNLERLQHIYGRMRPKELAPILDELDDRIVAIVLAGMEERRVAAILAEVAPQRAARLSKMVGGISSK